LKGMTGYLPGPGIFSFLSLSISSIYVNLSIFNHLPEWPPPSEYCPLHWLLITYAVGAGISFFFLAYCSMKFSFFPFDQKVFGLRSDQSLFGAL
jgi:hypothetical protein